MKNNLEPRTGIEPVTRWHGHPLDLAVRERYEDQVRRFPLRALHTFGGYLLAVIFIFTLDQLAHEPGVAGPGVFEPLTKSSFSPRVKDARNYYSAGQVCQLQAALRLGRKHRVSFEEALHTVFARASRAKEGSVA